MIGVSFFGRFNLYVLSLSIVIYLLDDLRAHGIITIVA